MLKRLLALLKAIPGLVFFALKASAMMLLCGILLVNLANSLPGRGVSSSQKEKDLPKLQPSASYKYDRSIVRLYRDGEFFCSGVVIGSNYVLTASHCLVDGDGVMEKKPVTVVNDDGSVRVVAKPSGVNLRMDWGLLLGDFKQIPGAMVWEVGFQPQPAVLACGYPQGAKAITCQVLIPMMNDRFLIKCGVGGMLFPGMSGGPVFDKEGHVVGLNVLVYPASARGGVAYSPTTGILADFGIAD